MPIMQQTTSSPGDKQQYFLQQLRSATDAQHKALEATPLSADLLKKDVTLQEYAKYLLYMEQVNVFYEDAVFPIIAFLFPDVDKRSKLAAIHDDIAVLQEKIQMPAVPEYNAAAPVGDVAFALGFMYVMEGSTLGGRILLNHVKSALGYDEQNGAHFFAVYGAATGPMWKEFLAIFSEYAVANNCEEQIIAGSNYAFSSIEKYFSL